MTGSSRPSRGRPTVVDPMAISEAAIAVWQQQGYAATGWPEIAEATGISTRTLIRHFSSRAQLAWFGITPATERLTSAAASVPDDVPLAHALRTIIQQSVSRTDKVAALAPSWVRLVTTEPELIALSATAHNTWTTALAQIITARRADLPAVIAYSIAVAYQAATFGALSAWAEAPNDQEAADAVDTMLQYLAPLTDGE